MCAMADKSEAFDDSSDALLALKVFTREALAYARQASLLHHDFGDVFPCDAAPGEDVVVLIHGFLATAGVLRPMRRFIESEAEAHTASFTYAPGPGVESVARRLGGLVRRLPRGTRLHLVGHSMGGVVARWFVQELGGDPRVVQTVSLASPFSGTRHARFMPAGVGRDMAPGSELLTRLVERAHLSAAVPHVSIAAGQDRVVTESALLGWGDELVIADSGHNGLLYHPRVAREIAWRVGDARVRASRSAA
jgi:pimeloyl-ACP methyl ester carboxylesterase